MRFNWPRIAAKAKLKNRKTAPQLICHIGSPKTGSTYLQRAFALNEKLLAQNNIIYPDLLSKYPDHIPLFFISTKELHPFAKEYGLKNKRDVKNLRKRMSSVLVQQLESAKSNIETVFVSSENLFGNLGRPGIQSLEQFLRRHFENITIFLYVRRQDDAILSMYAEFMKRGFSSDKFSDFVDVEFGPNPRVPFLSYKTAISNWIEVFGRENLAVRIFDRENFAGGDVFCDCLEAISNNGSSNFDSYKIPVHSNQSLSAPTLEFLRRINSAVPYAVFDAPNPARQELLPRLADLPKTPRPQMSPEMSKRIMQHFLPQNEWLKTTFFAETSGPLFPIRTGAPGSGNLGKISDEEFGKYSQLVFQ